MTTFIGFLLVSSDAFGCSCAGAGLDAIRPEDGATAVAVDAVPFLVYRNMPGDVFLRDAVTGEDVPMTVEQTAQGDFFVVRLVPTAPLEPLHPYTIEGDPGYSSVAFPVTFTTGEESDVDAPAPLAPLTVRQAQNIDDDCGSLYLYPNLDNAPADAFYETQVAWSEDFADAVAVSATDHHMLGRSVCGNTVRDLDLGDEVWVRARLVDLSGNEGPWSDDVHIWRVDGVGTSTSAGCASIGAVPLASVTLGLALLALALRVSKRPFENGGASARPEPRPGGSRDVRVVADRIFKAM